MSLITSCPNCSTSFVVTAEQIAPQLGKVRCGNCQHVFNAVDHLTDIPDETTAEILKPFKSPEPSNEASQAPIEAELEALIDATHQDESSSLLLDINPKPFSEASIDITDGIFNAKAKRSNWLLFVAIVLLGLLAIAQSIYFLRQDIATQWPQLKPHLVNVCESLQCKIELSKNADLLTIDDSDLKEDAVHKGLIHLTSTIINNARYAQAYPQLELTLTDANDIPILRRAFKPNEYLAATTNIDAGIPAGEEIHVNLPLTASGESVTGYRVFLTYDESKKP